MTGITARAVLQSGPAAAAIRALAWPDFLAQVRVAAAGQRLAVNKQGHCILFCEQREQIVLIPSGLEALVLRTQVGSSILCQQVERDMA